MGQKNRYRHPLVYFLRTQTRSDTNYSRWGPILEIEQEKTPPLRLRATQVRLDSIDTLGESVLRRDEKQGVKEGRGSPVH